MGRKKMRKLIQLSGVALLVLGSSVKGENEIDNFVSTHCESACNGESTACRDCYTQAVELWDQPQSMSWEDNPSDAVVADDLDINPHMGLEIPF